MLHWQGIAVDDIDQYSAHIKLVEATHFIWGCAGPVFIEDWGRIWASRMTVATFDPIFKVGYFLQDLYVQEIAELLLGMISQK